MGVEVEMAYEAGFVTDDQLAEQVLLFSVVFLCVTGALLAVLLWAVLRGWMPRERG